MTETVNVATDEPTLCEELDWYYNCYDSECGLKSVGLGGLAAAFDSDGNRHRGSPSRATVKVSANRIGKPVNDPWANPGHLAAFAKGRRVWAALTRIPYADQLVLEAFYTPHDYVSGPLGHGRPKPEAKRVVAAITRFRIEAGILQ